MVDLRDDLFSDMTGLFEPREKTLQTWLDEAFEALKSQYPSVEDFITYINSFSDPKDSELLIEIGMFYLVSKKFLKESYFKLIIMISAIEKMVNKDRKFQEFYQWIHTQEARIKELLPKIGNFDVKDFMKIMEMLENEYFDSFGSRRNVLQFFGNHLDQGDKIKLIRSMRANWTDTVWKFNEKMRPDIRGVLDIKQLEEKFGFSIEKHLMPYCYDWRKCYVDYGDCFPEFGCSLRDETGLLNQFLKKVVDDIYQIRNDLIHDARITPLSEENTILLARIGEKPVSVELTADELEKIFERGLKHYFGSLASKTS